MRETRDRVFVRLCSDRVAYEARPAKPRRYDLSKVKAVLAQGEAYELVVYTPYLIALRKGVVEVTMAQDGRLIIRRAENEEAARTIAEELLGAISNASGSRG